MSAHRFLSFEAFQQAFTLVQLHFKMLPQPASAGVAIADELSSLAVQS